MDFQSLIDEYKESDNINSPIWIWFSKEENSRKCKTCSQNIAGKNGSTSGLIAHLKVHHGPLRKINAWKSYEELSQLKENRINEKSKKRKNDEPEIQPKKQPKLSLCLNPKYARDDQRQVD